MNDKAVPNATSPCCGTEVLRDPIGYHCSKCGYPLYERSPYAD